MARSGCSRSPGARVKRIPYMISNMDKLAQVIARIGLRRAVHTGAVLAMLAPFSCGAPAPAPSPVKPPTGVDSPLPPAEFDEIRGHPMNDWTYVDSLEELHAVWVERFTLSSARNLDARTLWPYADAVLLNGDSWGIDSKSINLFYKDSSGHAYQASGAEHPLGEARQAALPISPDSLADAGWSALSEGAPLLRRESGTGFRIVAAIRASASCLECHAWTEGAQVGMLAYDFREIPDD